MSRHRPNRMYAYSLILHSDFWGSTQTEVQGIGYVPSRPVSGPSLRERIKLAWGVFTGRYDALIWQGQED